MRKPNEGRMWNSSTHAMSDICSLAYRGNVPACEVIVPAGAGGVETFEPRDIAVQTSSADVSWNRATPGRGRGRGALLQNRDVIHRNDEELQKQLRIANGLGYSNDLIEAKFQNSSSNELFHRTQTLSQETDTTSHVTTAQDTRTQQVEEVKVSEEDDEDEEDDGDNIAGGDNNDGGWSWETRTVKPAAHRIVLKNVALESLKRQNKNYPTVEPFDPASPEVVAPAPPASVSPVPRVKEDWRAECKALEQAQVVSQKTKKGWRASSGEPLLGDLKVDGNWSAFTPNTATPVAPLESYLRMAPAPAPEPAVESPPMSLFEGQNHRGRRKSKKKNQNVRVMYVPPPLRTATPPPCAAPAGYLMPTNGVSPLALRNPDYLPVGGRNMHRTFNNLFEQVAQNRDCRTFNRTGSFSLAHDEFPQLK